MQVPLTGKEGHYIIQCQGLYVHVCETQIKLRNLGQMVTEMYVVSRGHRLGGGVNFWADNMKNHIVPSKRIKY